MPFAPRCQPSSARWPRAALAGHGQASVEFVAVLPLILLLAGLAWQVVMAGHATWAAGAAAGVAARAHAVGQDAAGAARAKLPADLRAGMRVRTRDDGSVEVAVRIPSVVPGLELGHASATASMTPQSV